MSCSRGLWFYKPGAFSPLKESFWATDKISVEQKYPFPSSLLFFLRVCGSSSCAPCGEASGSKGAKAWPGVLQVENMLHAGSAQHSKPDISSQLIISL